MDINRIVQNGRECNYNFSGYFIALHLRVSIILAKRKKQQQKQQQNRSFFPSVNTCNWHGWHRYGEKCATALYKCTVCTVAATAAIHVSI